MNPMQQMLMQAMSGQGNPQQIVEQIASQNPQARAMLNQMRQSGMSPQQFTMQYAKQHGIDLNPMLEQMKRSGMKF